MQFSNITIQDNIAEFEAAGGSIFDSENISFDSLLI